MFFYIQKRNLKLFNLIIIIPKNDEDNSKIDKQNIISSYNISVSVDLLKSNYSRLILL